MRSFKVEQYETGMDSSSRIIELVMQFLTKAIDYIQEYDEAPSDFRDFGTLELMTIQKDKRLRVNGIHLYSENYGIFIDRELKLEIERVGVPNNTVSFIQIKPNGNIISDFINPTTDIVIYCNERFISFFYPSNSNKLHEIDK
jgi:hypothetical protein